MPAVLCLACAHYSSGRQFTSECNGIVTGPSCHVGRAWPLKTGRCRGYQPIEKAAMTPEQRAIVPVPVEATLTLVCWRWGCASEGHNHASTRKD